MKKSIVTSLSVLALTAGLSSAFAQTQSTQGPSPGERNARDRLFEGRSVARTPPVFNVSDPFPNSIETDHRTSPHR